MFKWSIRPEINCPSLLGAKTAARLDPALLAKTLNSAPIYPVNRFVDLYGSERFLPVDFFPCLTSLPSWSTRLALSSLRRRPQP